MDYEQKYKKALELMKNCVPDENDLVHVHPGDIFSELRESEDEQIRKEIEQLIQCMHDADPRKERWIAWLEKQGDNNNEDADILQRFSFYSYKDEPNVLYLSNVFVNEEYRNKGIGTKILKIADEVSTYLKCNSIRLKTENGSNAESLYRKNGYKTLKEEGNQIWLEKQVNTKKDVDDAYLKGICDTKHELEKQCEQESADKHEPKFHEGDLVVDNQGLVHQIERVVENVTTHTFGYDIVGGGYFNDESDVRLWTIQDAKDGDVLAVNGKPFICYHTDEYKGNYCCIDDKGCFRTNIRFSFEGNCILPATKEQRDLLFQKMKDAGYEWSEDTHELKKISQRMVSAESKEALWSNKYEGLTDFERTLADICIGWIGEELGWKQYIKDNADVLLKIAIEKFNSVQDIPSEERPAEWSEDDEKAIAIINNALTESNTPPDDYDKVYDWLESIKQRIGIKL